MILRARDLTASSVEADLCIAGGGAAGLTLAAALADSGLEIVVLEAGGPRPSQASQAYYAGEAAPGHPTPDEYRIRALGGSSTRWGGGCVRLDPIDFAERSWVEYSGWPIPYEEVARFYGQSLEAAEAGPAAFWPPSSLISGIDGEAFTTTLERFSRPTDFGVRWAPVLRRRRNVRVILEAPVVEVATAANGSRVEHLRVRTEAGQDLMCRARMFVLAMGGIEAARVLLASTRNAAEGVGNRHGWVGRGYMCHTAGLVAEAQFEGPAHNLGFGHDRDAHGIYVRRRLLLTEAAQRRLRILNVAFRLRSEEAADPRHGNAALSAVHLLRTRFGLRTSPKARREPILRHVATVARDPGFAAKETATLFRDRFLGRRTAPSLAIRSKRNRYRVEFHAEQAPNPSSRIRLDDTCDRLGVPRPRIDWTTLPIDVETVLCAHRLLDQKLRASGAGRLDYADEVLADSVRLGAYGGHHIGTTRMSAAPEGGVVDPNCAVHGISNLYVAGASVMPTSGQANPTLTILALTYRLAEHLRRRRP